MEDNDLEKLKKFIKITGDPIVVDFLDPKKLYKSGIFLNSVRFASEHAAKYGDYSYLNKILMMLGDSIYAVNLIESLRNDLVFIVSPDKPYRLKKASAQQVAEEAKKTAGTAVIVKTVGGDVVVQKKRTKDKLKENVLNSNKIKSTKNNGKRRGFKRSDETKSEDILDSRLMYSGSYGSGKKR